MNKYKVCVYAICKNEEKFVDKWMESMKEADSIIVTDTGSTDHTVERLREKGAVVFEEKINPWRFDVARNVSLSHVPDDTDICICTDLDELLESGWREKLEAAWVVGTHQGNYLYNWSLKPDGTPDVQFTYFKVHTKKDYIWQFPVHECLKYIGSVPERKVFINGMVLNHYPDPSKPRSQYLPLLELAFEEQPESDRCAYYLGREYMYSQEWQKCIDTLKIHLSLEASTWEEERCASMRWIAKSYAELNNLAEAYKWYYRAIAEKKEMRDAYVEFAQLAYSQDDLLTVYFLTQEALKIKERSGCYINMGYAWDYTLDDLASIACYYLGMYEQAYIHIKKAMEMEPNDERLIKNLTFIEEKYSHKKTAE